MLRHLSLLLLTCCAVGLADNSNAAIFRIQDSSWTYDQNDVNNPNASGANFLDGDIAGEFQINTKYRNAAGAIVTPAGEGTVTAWNVRIFGSGFGSTFTNGPDNAATYDSNTNTLSFSSSLGAETLSLGFDQSLLETLGNTIEADGTTTATTNNLWFSTIHSATYNGNSSVGVGAQGAQADFVPFLPSLLVFAPVLSRLRSFKSGFSKV